MNEERIAQLATKIREDKPIQPFEQLELVLEIERLRKENALQRDEMASQGEVNRILNEDNQRMRHGLERIARFDFWDVGPIHGTPELCAQWILDGAEIPE